MFLINLRLGNEHCRQLNDTVSDRPELLVDGLDLGFQVAEALGRAFASYSQRDFVDLVIYRLLRRSPPFALGRADFGCRASRRSRARWRP